MHKMADYRKIEKARRDLWLIKSDKEVKKIADEIRTSRLRKGLDNEPLEYGEMIKASFRFDPLLDILKKADIKRSKNEQKRTGIF